MLKGKAKIQLINPENNNIEYEKIEENLITNGIYNLLNPSGLFDMFNQATYRADYLKAYTPIKDLIGGIMLFSSEISEDKNNIIPSADLITDLTGVANIPFSGQSEYRGTLNEVESGFIDKGYRWTWDFGTNAANGGIKAIALSSQACNLDKSKDDTTITSIFCDYGKRAENSSTFLNRPYSGPMIIPRINYAAYGDFLGFIDKNNLLFVRYHEYKNINENEEEELITGYIFSTVTINNQIGLNTDIKYVGELSSVPSDIISKKEVFVQVPRVQKSDDKELNLSSPLYMTLEDGKVACFCQTYDSTSQVLGIYLRYINVSTYEVSNNSHFNFNNIDLGESTSAILYYSNDKIYITNKKNKNLYIVDVNNNSFKNFVLPKASMKAVKFLNSVVFTEIDEANGNRTLYFLKKDDSFAKWDVNIENTNNSAIIFGNFIFDSRIYPYPLFVVSTTTETSNTRNSYLNLCVFNPFFISINNISPVVKHQSQVLKIIYEVVEV